LLQITCLLLAGLRGFLLCCEAGILLWASKIRNMFLFA